MDITENIDLLLIEQPMHFSNSNKKDNLINIIDKIKIPIIVQYDSFYDNNISYKVIPEELHNKIHFLDLLDKERGKKISEMLIKKNIKKIMIGGAHFSDITTSDSCKNSEFYKEFYGSLLRELRVLGDGYKIIQGCISRAINDLKEISNNLEIFILSSITIGATDLLYKEKYTKKIPSSVSLYYSLISKIR